jgi:hypothetical protein
MQRVTLYLATCLGIAGVLALPQAMKAESLDVMGLKWRRFVLRALQIALHRH